MSGLRLRKRHLDISGTYDGVTVVSERFKRTCSANSISGLRFITLPDDPEFFAVQATRAVRFDADRREVRFLGLCPKCERYAEVIGASPVYLLPGESTGDREIVRTDLEFASHDERSPVLLCGDAAAAALKKARLKGLVLLPEHPH